MKLLVMEEHLGLYLINNMEEQPWGMTVDEFMDGIDEIAMAKEEYEKLWEAAIEYDEMLTNVSNSHKRDYDGSRRRYADRVSTASALIRRTKIALAQRNGHGGPG